MSDIPRYPISIYFKDTGEWVKDKAYTSEMELIVGLEFADTEENDDAWAVKAIDAFGRDVNLKVEAINLKRFELTNHDSSKT